MYHQANFQYPGWPGYGGIPGQPGAHPVSGGTPEANGNGWDPATAHAAPPFYPQAQQGWGGYYSELENDGRGETVPSWRRVGSTSPSSALGDCDQLTPGQEAVPITTTPPQQPTPPNGHPSA